MPQSIDPRWTAIARDWLSDSLPEALVKRYTPDLAQQLHDLAEQFVEADVPELEDAREQALAETMEA